MCQKHLTRQAIGQQAAGSFGVMWSITNGKFLTYIIKLLQGAPSENKYWQLYK